FEMSTGIYIIGCDITEPFVIAPVIVVVNERSKIKRIAFFIKIGVPNLFSMTVSGYSRTQNPQITAMALF
ncbi:hypothetical protein ACFLVF_02825, partial [Chloroflexota bacterium]